MEALLLPSVAAGFQAIDRQPIRAQQQRLETCLLLSESPCLYQQQRFKVSLSTYRLNYATHVFREPLIVKEGTSARLSTTTEAESVLPLQLIKTPSFDQFKAWVGTPDALFDRGIFPMQEVLPSDHWQRTVTNGADLTPIEREDIDRAGRVYLFGHSQLVASYKAVIEQLYAPFEAAIYAFDKVVIEPGAVLSIEGSRPVILLIGQLDIVEGGHLLLCVPTKMSVQLLQKK